MSQTQITPNELADLYDGLFNLLEQLPEETHPGWVFAIESVIFGGEGLAEKVACYGEQQADRNEFAISSYREAYGNGTHVTDFPAIETVSIDQSDVTELDTEVQVPATPVSGNPLPVFVGEDELARAVSLLNEFPGKPEAGDGQRSNSRLLNPSRFPGLTPEKTTSAEATAPRAENDTAPVLDPNELAEVYDGLRQLYNALPDDAHPVWSEAIKTVLFGGEYLVPGQAPYGEQQAERNDFGMPDYREAFGDGERVTNFSLLSSAPADASDVSRTLCVPESGQPIPLSPPASELTDALSLLAEFPARPAADTGERSDGDLLFIEGLVQKAEIASTSTHTEQSLKDDTSTTSSPIASDSREKPATESQSTPTETASQPQNEATEADEESTSSIILEKEAGETSTSFGDVETRASGSESKYDDPRAQSAHERAQRRHPSTVVEKGEEIEIVLQEVDYKYTEPTIMGKVNDLVVFIEDAPQGLERFDVVRARIVGYGSGNTCAKAVFTGYAA
jgi:hypothetical protein